MIDTLPVDSSPSFPDPLAIDSYHVHQLQYALQCVRPPPPRSPHSPARSSQQHSKSSETDPLSFDARLLCVPSPSSLSAAEIVPLTPAPFCFRRAQGDRLRLAPHVQLCHL